MAPYSLRLRRAVSLSSSLIHQHYHHCPHLHPSKPILSPLSSNLASHSSALKSQNLSFPFNSQLQSFRFFRSSPVSLSYRNRRSEPEGEPEIGPDTILFEGCDYNHWLITVEFPKDERELTAEEKVEFYVQTAAKVFGSVEEAKQKIYACSTTVYQGFQVLCSEETSEKFKDLPGVVFVLPDSYIDPVNKEYGGDKYVNGTIIPRPPPMYYRNMRSDRRPRPQRSDNRGSMQGEARNYGPPQGLPPQQNYGPPQGLPPQQNYGPPQGLPPQQNYGPPQGPPPQQNYGVPSNAPQQNYGYPPSQQTPPSWQKYGQPQNVPPRPNYGHQQNFAPQQNYGPQGSTFPTQQNYGPTGRVEWTGPTNAPGGWNQYQGGGKDSPQRNQEGHTSSGQRSYGGQGQNYTASQGGNLNQGFGLAQRQEMDPASGQNFPVSGEDQRFSPGEIRNNTQGGEQRNYTAMGMEDQGRY